MNRINPASIIENAIESKTYTRADGSSFTNYTLAVQAYGSEVAHAMTYTIESKDPSKVLASARPYCGSRRTLAQHTGAFRKEVTCKRCR